ncbi:thiol methyltransferase [Lophiostoma macrostomum CBS 122681]|uniref:Thiol methyltransferase n=1 Tax=Lophiostoma macrostomum CBS 122681 TaxID=1314788 RepID=A0A6A6T3J0_9PLEO|nr:thiol methyltransferase [Lophiostoma macrostomum CBS 122681]
MAETGKQPPTRLMSHFTNRSEKEQSSAWTSLWETNENDLWDRGGPNPALIDFIESRPGALPKARDGRKLKALVPGCGKGYDVASLALHNITVFGLEISEKGAGVARQYCSSQLSSSLDYNFGKESSTWRDGEKGEVRIIAGDFFARDWEAQCRNGVGDRAGFDLIYDYTFLCALLPSMRPDWRRRMSELLAPDGILVCLEFPMYKNLKAAGPPWGLNGVHWDLLAEGNSGVIDEPGDKGEGKGGQFERLSKFKPERSYEAGRDSDMVSVWRLKR